jgi:DNA-binding LytR/AlgR family response regulator
MNILIAEDEPKTAKLLKELIENQDANNKVLYVCDSIEGTVNFIKTTPATIDLLFMDIMLADGNSFDIFNQVKITAPVVFCTAYDDYIMQAFKHNGIDYILKPFKEKDIENAFVKIKQLKQALVVSDETAKQMAAALKPPAAQQSSFLVQFREKMYPVQVKDIALVALENEVLYLYTFNNEKHPVFKPIEEVESVLEPGKFYRINRQMLINREAIVAIEPIFNRKVLVKATVATQEKPVVSRLKVTAFLAWVERG